ncbi:hypothetical protein EDD22DRAFT_957328 [Suillus occidentalis]|nr:hypothetical protein EDD22DRAFT_957328 [Suillus occidentalis]
MQGRWKSRAFLEYWRKIESILPLFITASFKDSPLLHPLRDEPIAHFLIPSTFISAAPSAELKILQPAQATSTATSTRPTPNEPLLCFPSCLPFKALPSPPASQAPPSPPASKAPPSHPPSKASISTHTFREPQFSHALDKQAGTGGWEQVGGGSVETDMREGKDMHYGGEQDDGSS